MNSPVLAEIVEGWNPREETPEEERKKRIAEIRARPLSSGQYPIPDERFDLMYMLSDNTMVTREDGWYPVSAVGRHDLTPETKAQARLALNLYGVNALNFTYYSSAPITTY